MKLLVATRATQGRRANDFSWTRDGEIVTFGAECSAEETEGPCGCRRSMSGIESLKATTTVKVVDFRDLSLPAFVEMLAAWMVKCGYFPSAEEALPDAERTAACLLEATEPFPPGTILERRGDDFRPRLVLVR